MKYITIIKNKSRININKTKTKTKAYDSLQNGGKIIN